MNSNQEMLNRNFNELIELKHVLHTDDTFFAAVSHRSLCCSLCVARHSLLSQASHAEASIVETEEQQNQRLLAPSSDSNAGLVKLGCVALPYISQFHLNLTTSFSPSSFVTGVILRDKFASFERVLWRATRGNLFMKHAEIDDLLKDPHTVRPSACLSPPLSLFLPPSQLILSLSRILSLPLSPSMSRTVLPLSFPLLTFSSFSRASSSRRTCSSSSTKESVLKLRSRRSASHSVQTYTLAQTHTQRGRSCWHR